MKWAGTRIRPVAEFEIDDDQASVAQHMQSAR